MKTSLKRIVANLCSLLQEIAKQRNPRTPLNHACVLIIQIMGPGRWLTVRPLAEQLIHQEWTKLQRKDVNRSGSTSHDLIHTFSLYYKMDMRCSPRETHIQLSLP